MKYLIFVPVALLVALAGCANTKTAEPPLAAQSTSAPVRLTATQELEKYCRVCVVDKGEKMQEFLPSRLTVAANGQNYKFCSEPCRKKFDANRKKYLLCAEKAK